MGDLLLVAVIVFAINLLPAFAPPTWAVLVAVRLNWDVAAVPLVLVGAAASTSGRVVLALGARRFRNRFSERRRASLQALADEAQARRGAAAGLLGLFLLSPLPSGQMWTAAGLTGVRLPPLALAFFAGRLVSYSIYVAAASAARDSLRDVLGNVLSSPLGIEIQIGLLAGLVLLVRVDWAALLARHRHNSTERRAHGPSHA